MSEPKPMTEEMLQKARAKGFKLVGCFVLVVAGPDVGHDGYVTQQAIAKDVNVLTIRSKNGIVKDALFRDVKVIA